MNRFVICGVSDNGKVRCYDREDGQCEDIYPEQLKALGIECDIDYSYDYAYKLWFVLEDTLMLDRPMPVYRMDTLCSYLRSLYSQFGYGLPETACYQHRFTRVMYKKKCLGLFLFDIRDKCVVVNVVNMFKSGIVTLNITIDVVVTVDDIYNKRLLLFMYNMYNKMIRVGFNINYGTDKEVVWFKYQFDNKGNRVAVTW